MGEGVSLLGSLCVCFPIKHKLELKKPHLKVPPSTIPKISVDLGSPMEQIGKCFDEAGLLMRDALEAVDVKK